MSRVYLDYNATAPLRPEARAAMIDALATVGNASSVHGEGREARKRTEAARSAVARLVGGQASLVTFTSGGTEANVTALTPHWTLKGKPHGADLLFVTAVEHVSVLSGGRFAPNNVRQITVDANGVVCLEALADLLNEARAAGQRALVSVMLANNETGVIQPVAAAARLAHAADAIVHCDAIQTVGRMPVDIAELGVDVLSLSAHKIGGPQGAGAIVRASADLDFAPLLAGGGQERRTRAGTENVAAIAGFGAAAETALAGPGEAERLAGLRDGLLAVIREAAPSAVALGEGAARLPQTLCVALDGIPAETLVIALDLEGVAVSSGSACSSGKVGPSHVTAAMGVAPSLAKGAIRLSLGWDSKDCDLHLFSSAWQRVLKHLAPGRFKAA